MEISRRKYGSEAAQRAVSQKHSIFIIQASVVIRMHSTKQHKNIANTQEDVFKIFVLSMF